MRQLVLLLAIPLTLAAISMNATATGTAGQGAEPDQPGTHVRVVSPHHGFLVGAAANRKLLIALEVTSSKYGLLKTRTGEVEFLEPNANVRLFGGGIVATSEYTNHFGETVVQIVSLVPVEMLQHAPFTVAPPIDFFSARPPKGEVTYAVPQSAMAEAAEFNFQVQDLAGQRSRPEGGNFIIGLPKEIWRPKSAP